LRPRDINIEAGIGLREERRKYYSFNDPAINGFDDLLSKKRGQQGGDYKVVDIFDLKIIPLSKVLADYLPNNQAIDFITVDVEGLDFEVLQSNDWSLYRPELVLVEQYAADLEEMIVSDIVNYMRYKEYVLFAKTTNTIFFKNQRVLWN
jgi:hypothetical protein